MFMFRHRIRKARGKPPSRPAAGRPRPMPHTPTDRSDPFALSPQFLGALYGTKEFPIVQRPIYAISCRVASQPPAKASPILPSPRSRAGLLPLPHFVGGKGLCREA